MKKKFLALTLAAALLCSSVPAFGAQSDIKVSLNNETINFEDQQPVIKDGRTLVPIRGVLEKMGVKVTYIEDLKTVSMEKGAVDASLKIGDDTLYVNGEAQKLDVAPEIINSRTMLPIRAVAEAFGAEVGWDDETKTVEINVLENETKLSKHDVFLKASDDTYYSIATEYWFLKSASGKELLNATVIYPSLNGKTASDGIINAYIAKTAQTIAESYIDENKNSLEREAVALQDDFKTNEIYVSFEDMYHSDDKGILSYLLTVSVYTGGAHFNTTAYGMTIDLETGTEVTVSDIAGATGENAISDYERAVNYLKDKLLINKDDYFEGAAEFVADDTTPGNYGCYFGDSKLIIFAAPGTIKPYSSGIVKFEESIK